MCLRYCKTEKDLKNELEGQSETAANQLNAFINELDAQKDQKITSEGYYLLKPIAEYLITRL